MEENVVQTQLILTEEEKVARGLFYKNLKLMRELKEKSFPQFQTGPNGPRSFLDFLDDAEGIVNLFTPSRDEAGKDDWQANANVAGAEIRAKMRAVAAGVGLQVPEMAFEAIDKNGIRSQKRAEIFKNIVKQTYMSDNPRRRTFLETWQLLSHGTVFEYEGYKTGGMYQDVVESFNSLTGEVKTKREFVKMDGKPFNILLNPQEFYWWTMFVDDVQLQPRVALVQNYTRAEVELEFSQYKNYKYVQSKRENQLLQLQDSAFFQKYYERSIPEDGFQVARIYSKEDDGSDSKSKGYEVWINGVPMIRCPLLWGGKEKVYPFVKEVNEPFANSNFFVGMPFPMLLEGYGDNKNMLSNSLVDKVARGLDPLKLVGLQNRDLLDVESEIQTADSTIYVPDVNAVKFMESPQVNQGELLLMQMLDRGIEIVSIDRTQQGQASSGRKTAREVMLANKRAEELKGNLYLALENLWYQKSKLRVGVVLSEYLKDKAAAKSIKDGIISIENYNFGDGTRGTLDIHIAKSKGKLLTLKEIEARELAMQQQGENYKIISILLSYLNEYQLDFKIVPESIRKTDQSIKEDDLMSELDIVVKLFPEFFIANKDKYLARFLEIHGRHPDEYTPPSQQPAKPQNKIAESINYKDAPPDIRRQMEAAAGMTPSKVNEVSPNAAPATATTPGAGVGDILSKLHA